MEAFVIDLNKRLKVLTTEHNKLLISVERLAERQVKLAETVGKLVDVVSKLEGWSK